jgi:hypothetical protein
LKRRERRRYLTQKYQQKQVRLANQLRGYRPYDSQRYLQRPLAVRQRFYNVLAGNYVGRYWKEDNTPWRDERQVHTEYMLGYDPEPYTPAQLGRFRNHSWDDCGRARCHMCSNPRRGWTWDCPKERITMQERINNMRFKDDLEYFYEYEEKQQ